jgi:DNA-binding MarR family transcriptional regulator
MANSDDLLRMEGEILQRLYEPFFLSFDGANLRDLPEKEGVDKVTYNNLLDRMSNAGFITGGFGGNYRITGRGTLRAEELGVTPDELTRTNQKARTDILLALAKVYEGQGRLYSAFKWDLEKELGIEGNILTGNLRVLVEAGYAEHTQNTGRRITDLGLVAVAEHRKTKGIADEFERISELAPQPRGRALQKLVARMIAQQGWETDEGVRTSHEEMDVIVWREREYYLLECKWEKDPIEAGVVRELLGKLSNRVGVNGITMSMSGFSKGAVEQTEAYASQRVILLFGEEGIKKLVYGRVKFTELLNIKYRQLAMKTKAEVT